MDCFRGGNHLRADFPCLRRAEPPCRRHASQLSCLRSADSAHDRLGRPRSQGAGRPNGFIRGAQGRGPHYLQGRQVLQQLSVGGAATEWRGDFLLAIMTSRLLLMVIEIGLLLVFGVLFFHMRVLGSVFSIALLGGLGSLTFGGVGLLTASRAQKIESISGLINLVMMPMWIFSGVFFSYERFPAVIHPLIKALPLTALNDALRASILEGTPLLHQWPRLVVLALWGGISFVLALKWFRWT